MELVRPNEVSTPFDIPYANGGDRGDRDVFHVTFDPETESVDAVVVESVAAIQNCEPEELDPIYEAIEPDALDEVITPSADTQSDVELEFVYEGMDVTVEASGDLWLQWR